MTPPPPAPTPVVDSLPWRLPAVLLLLTLLWAALYLPGLGGPELKGEEGRRVLPALTMLENGDWVLPRLNGEPYLRKPPLINWVIAASVSATGSVSEWSVRLPSVFAVWGLALFLAWSGSRWMGRTGGLLAGLYLLINASYLEKGRLAEIEAVYIGLSGVALGWWVAGWMRRERGWRLWLVPMLALALGTLAKGPVPHVLFFYGVVVLLLHASGEKRQLLSAAHLLCGALALGVVLLWWLPYRAATADLGAGAVMAKELAYRIFGRFEPVNLPRAFANALPWILFAPLWWSRPVLAALRARDERLALLVQTLRLPLLLAFIGLMLIGGMLPRYTLPLYPLLALLLALVTPYAPFWSYKGWDLLNRALAVPVVLGLPLLLLASRWGEAPVPVPWLACLAVAALALWSEGRAWRARGEGQLEPVSLALRTGVLCIGGMTLFHLGLIEHVNRRDTLRPVGVTIAAEVPQGEPLYVIDPGYEASLFYVRHPLVYVDSVKKVPQNASYVLARTREYHRLQERLKRDIRAISLREKGKKEFFLLKLSPERETTPRPNSGEAKNRAGISNSND